MTTDVPIPERALAIGAHPDDVEFGCGATVAKWAAAGTDVQLVVLTDGSRGTWDVAADIAALIVQRQDEMRSAAAALGARGTTFLDAVDGELDSGLKRRQQVCEMIRRHRPDVVLGHDPWKRYRLHPDHRHAGWLAVDGIVAARDPHFFPEQGLPPHRPRALLLFEPDETDHLERIDDTHLAAKVSALLAHRSQWRSTLDIESDSPDERRQFSARVRGWASAAAGGDGLAEPFKLLDDL